MTEEFFEGKGKYDSSMISIQNQGIHIYKGTVNEIAQNTDLPERMKFGIDVEAGWILGRPCFGNGKGYKTRKMERDEGFTIGSTKLVKFYTERIPGLTKEDIPVRYPAFWDKEEDQLVAEFA